MDLSLKGKYGVICGSTQGIGLAIAKELALQGLNCTLLARNETVLAEIAAQLPVVNDNQLHNFAVADFTDNNAVRNAIAQIVKAHPVHVLINNTGGPPPGSIIDAETTSFIEAFKQHLENYQLLVQAVLPGMRVAGFGRVINIISTSVRIPIANLGVSNTIRAATAGWAKTLSNEIAQYGITVNSILPGYTKTSRLDSLLDTIAEKEGKVRFEVARTMMDEIPARRFGEPEEIAAVAAFLASPAAAYVNGISIPVDGGRTGTI